MTEPTTLPKTAESLREKAEAAGWTVETLELPGDLLVLRMRRDGRTVAATWRAGKFSFGAVLARVTEGERTLTPLPHRISSKQVGELIAS